MLLDLKKTAEAVKIQRIEIEYNYLMSINTTSLLFAERKSWPSKGQDLGVLNFWVERDPVGLKEEGDKEGKRLRRFKKTSENFRKHRKTRKV